MTAERFLNEIKAKITASPAISGMAIVCEHSVGDHGYFRARLTLSNTDFLEVSEYFVIKAANPATVEYRYQWMDSAKQRLIKRWDNASHFPQLSNFPHHIHMGDESQVTPGKALSIVELIDIIESELS